MCLLTRQIKPIITKKDMIVVKRLTIDDPLNSIHGDHKIHYFSHYSDVKFEYIPEVLNTTELGIRRCKPKDTKAFSDKDTRYYKEGPLVNRNLTAIEQGFHFVVKDSPMYHYMLIYDKLYLLEFLVPKGSTIFLGKTGLGVSNQIIMLKP